MVASILATRLFVFAGGPEVEIISCLKTAEKDGVTLAVPGTPRMLASHQLHFDRIVVNVHADQKTATAIATLDFRGALSAPGGSSPVGATAVSSLGLEKIDLILGKGGAWSPVSGDSAPTLTAALGLLERRRQVLETGDASLLSTLVDGTAARNLTADPRLLELLALKDRHYQVDAYYLRADRDEVLVTAEDHLTGNLPDRPVDSKTSRRLKLGRPAGKTGREFLFTDGLM